MSIWEILFFISCFLVFYNYAGYAILAFILNRFSRRESIPADDDYQPSVSFIVAAFNEEDCIAEKIENSLQQNYPAGKIEFLFITDGSTDNTMDIVSRYPTVRLLHSPERRGKSAALNRAVEEAVNEVLIFSDANTLLNSDTIKNITRHYADPMTGGVAGEKKVIAPTSTHETGAGEGLYWKYESLLKKIDSDFYSVVGAAGELFSLRRTLYEPIPHSVILDDFVISLRVVQKGYRVIYEPDAYATELPSFSLKDEQKRKVRIAAGGFQAMGLLASLFRFWKHFRLSFLYISHRVLRWTLSPLCLILAFVSNLILCFDPGHLVYRLFFAAQLAFYAMAFIASLGSAKNIKLFKLAYYFVFMNLSVVQGFFRHLQGGQPATWEKAKRSQASPSA